MTTPGDLINGRYRLVRRLGGGGMGTVWKAFDVELERPVAVKALSASPFGTEDTATRQKRLKLEATALAQVKHPVVVTVHDLIYASPDQAPWIVMAYIPGRSLREIIQEHPDTPLAEHQIAAIGLAVLDGLQACHASEPRVYHRDVKPGNIVVGLDWSVHLVDFGIARIDGHQRERLTDARSFVGTAAFAAPELIDGEPSGPGTDLWALGVTLYYALTGWLPFAAEKTEAVLWAVKFKNPPEPREGGPLASLVLQMLRKRPEERPKAGEVATILRGVASQPEWSGNPYGTAQPPPGTERPSWGSGVPTQPPHVGGRPVPKGCLSGLPALTQAQVVASMPKHRAVSELLALSKHDAARIVNRCDDALGGSLLSAIAIPPEPLATGPQDGGSYGSERPGTARKLLLMLTRDRCGSLLCHMSSVALAAVLALPPAEESLRIADRADIVPLVGALSEMPPPRAAALVEAMEAARAAEVVRRVGPVRAADILRYVPARSAQEILGRLPEIFRASVLRYLSR